MFLILIIFDKVSSFTMFGTVVKLRNLKHYKMLSIMRLRKANKY